MSSQDQARFAALPRLAGASSAVALFGALGIGGSALFRPEAEGLPVAACFAAAGLALAGAVVLHRYERPLLAARTTVLVWLATCAGASLAGDLHAVVSIMPLLFGAGIGLAALFDARTVIGWAVGSGLVWATVIRARTFLYPAEWEAIELPVGLIAYIPMLGLLLLAWTFRAVVHARDDARLRAEASNRAKSVFLANMSHELRTPLNAIQGYTELLMEDAEGAPDSDASLRDLGHIRKASHHLLQLIDDVLDLSRIEAGRYEIVTEPTDIRPILDEVVATLKPLAAERGNSLETTLRYTGALHTDPRALRQVLFNLLSNACKFTEQGHVQLEVLAESDQVRFAISDTGIGMSADELERVQRPFEQASQKISVQYGGTGLGLAITAYLVEALGGQLDIDSTPGEGTCVTADFPRDAP